MDRRCRQDVIPQQPGEVGRRGITVAITVFQTSTLRPQIANELAQGFRY